MSDKIYKTNELSKDQLVEMWEKGCERNNELQEQIRLLEKEVYSLESKIKKAVSELTFPIY